MATKWVIAGSHPLDSIFKVSAFHLATHLAQRSHNEVFYLCAPISPLHHTRPSSTTDLQVRLSLWRDGPKRWHDRLWEYCPRTWLPCVNRPLFRSRWVARQTLRWTRPPLRRVLDDAGFGLPDVVMIINLQYADLFGMLARSSTVTTARPLLVYRNIDEIRGMAHIPPSMSDVEREIALSADAVLTASVVQEQKMRRLGVERVFRLPHGVDLAMFQGPMPPAPQEYGSIARPRVVFVGALTQWVDHQLLVEAARLLPNVSFVFIGPADPPFPQVLNQRNQRYLGPRPYEAVPAYLRHADAAIIPFAKSPIVESAHPLKLLTYLAAGLPTVCTAWQELEAMRLPVRVGRTAKEFACQIDRALTEPRDPGLAESVRPYDWPRIIDQLEAIIATLKEK
ncbi:glycosyltransferase [Candidatus Sumerlaeota bacterium]|nr:glycosyltransferase [Candidatus Sumerlaeota bacterium]